MIYTYDTLARPSEGSYQESGSKFLSYLYPVESRDAFDGCLLALREAHPRARHHCYAYRILDGQEVTEFASDAGEPSGSAGAPILGVLRKHALVNVCAIVVRYFGGTKLGIPGLIHAYREGVTRAVEAGTVVSAERKDTVVIRMPLALQPMLYDACKHLGVDLTEPVYGNFFEVILKIPAANGDLLLQQLLSRIAGIDGDTASLCQRLDATITGIGN